MYCMPDFSNNLVRLNPTPFLQSTANPPYIFFSFDNLFHCHNMEEKICPYFCNITTLSKGISFCRSRKSVKNVLFTNVFNCWIHGVELKYP